MHCLQESHCRPVRQLLFNAVDASCSNLFATVGGDQATVYDDMHMGDYIAVVLNFVNARTSHAAGQVGSVFSSLLDTSYQVRCRVASCAPDVTGGIGRVTSLPVLPGSQVTRHCMLQGLQALAWLSADELSSHPNGDAFLVGPVERSASLLAHPSALLPGAACTCLHAPVLTWQACQCRQLRAALERLASLAW